MNKNIKNLFLALGYISTIVIACLVGLSIAKPDSLSRPLHIASNPYNTSDGSDDTGKKYTINGKTFSEDALVKGASPKATDAVTAYIRQSPDESQQARKTRLTRFLSKDSPAITRRPPAIKQTSSIIPSDIRILSSNWNIKDNIITMTYNIEISASGNSFVYQVYDVPVKYTSGTFTPTDVILTDKKVRDTRYDK